MTSLYKHADCLGVITDIHAVLLALQIDYDVVLGGEGGGTLAPEDPTHGHPMLTQVEVVMGGCPPRSRLRGVEVVRGVAPLTLGDGSCYRRTKI